MSTIWLDDTVEVLGIDEMYRADAAAAAAGVATLDLMEAAGAAVAERVTVCVPTGRVAILCGPGNNGGDGFIAARLLAKSGREVRVALLGDANRLKGDAAANARRWTGDVSTLSPHFLEGAAVIIDALFGAGLARPLDGAAAEIVAAVNDRDIACIAVDVPSGIDGDTGRILGIAPRALETVTFFRRKPAHLLYPARGVCGFVRVADIGIPADVLDEIAPQTVCNGPALWGAGFPCPQAEDHKYSRGHVVVAGGETMTGAARLASQAALRVGAGLVTIFSPPAAGPIYRAGHPAVLVRDIASAGEYAEALDDRRISTLLLGPGLGLGDATRRRVLDSLAAGRNYVLDADALSVFADAPETLYAAIAGTRACVLTPHEGEFQRLFGDAFDKAGGKLARARAAARLASSIVIIKGPDTVIAGPDGRAAINANAPSELATAGAGDVLAGFVAGLLAQGMPAFEAACAGVWLHGAAAAAFGPGLVASDIAEALPSVLRQFARGG